MWTKIVQIVSKYCGSFHLLSGTLQHFALCEYGNDTKATVQNPQSAHFVICIRLFWLDYTYKPSALSQIILELQRSTL